MLTWEMIKGVGPARRFALEEAGFFKPEQLVEHLPIGYRDTTHTVPIANLRPGDQVAFEGEIMKPAKLIRQAKYTYVTASLQDATGILACTWFSAPWMLKNLPPRRKLRLYARISQQKNGQIFGVNPIIVDQPSIQPLYRPIDKIPPKTMRNLIAATLAAGRFDEMLPETFRNRHHLCPRQIALAQVHFPESHSALQEARRRLAFEELTLFQMQLLSFRDSQKNGVKINADKAVFEEFYKLLPFQATEAQRRVLEEIRVDLENKAPMIRLVQGDVGSGKTAIAFGAIFFAVKAGFQAALMAPTDVLASQHFRTALKILEPAGIRCILLTGKLPAAQRREALHAIQSGEAGVIIGTHALISKDVKYRRLGLAITDEQHRFGVRQRTALSDKAGGPLSDESPINDSPDNVLPAIELPTANVLVLSATPIPRTLSLILYGDLDVSIVDEMPKGRVPVKTHILPEAKREGLYGFIREQAALGYQTYIICPLVSESERYEAASAQEMYDALRNGALSQLRVGLAHGRQRPEEQSKILHAFSNGLLDVLVSTTVIEVGVDVPNATIMVIENADRFGLSQLHQLRGRVGRGSRQSYCFLMANPDERLEALSSTTDGFAIAQKDLEQRGPGEWFGTRQHGAPILPGAVLGADMQLLQETQQAVKQVLSCEQQTYEAEQLKESARQRFGALLEKTGVN